MSSFSSPCIHRLSHNTSYLIHPPQLLWVFARRLSKYLQHFWPPQNTNGVVAVKSSGTSTVLITKYCHIPNAVFHAWNCNAKAIPKGAPMDNHKVVWLKSVLNVIKNACLCCKWCDYIIVNQKGTLASFTRHALFGRIGCWASWFKSRGYILARYGLNRREQERRRRVLLVLCFWCRVKDL